MSDKDVTKKEEVVSAEEEAVKEVEETLTGIVNVKLLNVRKEPSKESDVVEILDKDTTIEIFESESTKDFYKTTNGYVMKQFIDII